MVGCNLSPRLGQDCCTVHPGRKSKTWEPRGGQREKEKEREGWTSERVRSGKAGDRERVRESNGQRVAKLFLTQSPWKRDVSLCQFAPLTSL